MSKSDNYPTPFLPTLMLSKKLTSPSGSPSGKIVTVAGKFDGYLATPPADKAHKDTFLLYLPDVFGIWPNSQLMADQFAANGYQTLVLDLFNGDALKTPPGPDFDFPKWLTQGSSGGNPHTKEAIDPIVEAALKEIKEKYGAKKIGALGYCFGAKVCASKSRLSVCLPSALADT